MFQVSGFYYIRVASMILRLMDKILHDPKDPKLWELWYIPYYGSCRILSINRMKVPARDLRFRGLMGLVA